MTVCLNVPGKNRLLEAIGEHGRAIAAPPGDFVRKPFDPDELLARLSSMIAAFASA